MGGAWLVVSRLGLQPFDLSTDIVRLTAVHFHYAGFGLALLAATGLACADWMASRVALSIGSIAAIVGPPMVAVGFVTDSALGQVGGAVVVTVAAWAVGFGTFLLATSSSPARVAPSWERGLVRWTGRMLLIVSSLSPLLPMLLAVQWALAQHWDVPGARRARHGQHARRPQRRRLRHRRPGRLVAGRGDVPRDRAGADPVGLTGPRA